MSNELPKPNTLPPPQQLHPFPLQHQSVTPIPPPPRSIASNTAINVGSSSDSHAIPSAVDDDSTMTIPESITDPEEYNFLNALVEFHADNDSLSRLKKYPIINGQPLDLYLLFKLVTEKGGYTKTVRNGPSETKHNWIEIYKKLTRNYDPNQTEATIVQLKEIYSKFLLEYEAEHFGPLQVAATAATTTATPTTATGNGSSSTNTTQSNASSNGSPSPSSAVGPTNNGTSSSVSPMPVVPALKVENASGAPAKGSEIVFRFYITKNWLTGKKQFLHEKPKPVFDIRVELDNSPIAHAITQRLPILEHCNKFGEQLVYFTCPSIPPTPEFSEQEDRLSNEVMPIGSLAYWRAGSSLVLGWGSTPAAKNGECRLLEPCVAIGRWVNSGDKYFSQSLTQALSRVTHTTTQLQLKRRIDRTADKLRDLDYIIVEVQPAEYFSANDPNEQARTLAKQVYMPTSGVPSIKSPATPTGPPGRGIRPSTAPVLTTLNSITNNMNRTPTISPMSPGIDKQLPHPVHNGPPPPMMRPPYPFNQQAQRDNESFYDHKRKEMPKQDSIRSNESPSQYPGRPGSPQNKPGASRYPTQPNMASRSSIQPSYIQPLPYGQSQNQRSMPTRPGSQKRLAEPDLNLDAKMAKRARLVKKVPIASSLPSWLTEAGKDELDKQVHHVIIRYKYKGESDNDCRMIKKSLVFTPKPHSTVDDEAAPAKPESTEEEEATLTGSNIVYLLQQDNVDIQDLEEVRHFEKGVDLESSGWVLLESDYKCALNQQESPPDLNLASSTTTTQPETNGNHAPEKSSSKTIIKLLLKK